MHRTPEVAHDDARLNSEFESGSASSIPTYIRQRVGWVTSGTPYRVTDLDRCLHAGIGPPISRRLKKSNVSGTFPNYHGILTCSSRREDASPPPIIGAEQIGR